MYEGLYDTRKGLSEPDATLIGEMTARLLLAWDRWVHRRVERATFCDEDAIHRHVSIDFTLPHWFHGIRKEESGKSSEEARRHLVPLGFISKGALINFSLRDEHGDSLPLLTKAQNAQVAAAALTAVAKEALGGVEVPEAIRCDIRQLVSQPANDAYNTLGELFNAPDGVATVREQLRNHKTFMELAAQFAESFLALSMLQIRPQERRVVYFSHEKQLRPNPRGGFIGQLLRTVRLAAGGPRRQYLELPSVSEAASYHLEVEAPDGLMISERSRVKFMNPLMSHPVAGGFRRAHFHFAHMPYRPVGVAIRLLPRRSAIVRFSTLIAFIALVSTTLIAIRYPHIRSEKGNEVATAILLTATGFLGLGITRSGEGDMATALLFPLRVLAAVPVVLAIFAALVVVYEPSADSGRGILLGLSCLMAVSAALLCRNWYVSAHP